MTQKQALELIKLLSAIESWSFANGHKMPDYLYDHICEAMEILEKEVLK